MQIIVPSWADVEEPRFKCRICDDRFVNMRAWEAHVIKCSKIHEHELHEFAAWKQRMNLAPDPEWADYNEDLRRRGIDPMEQFGRRGKKPLRES